MQCPKCHHQVTPQVVPAPSGMTARFCPDCGASFDSVLTRDASQVKVPTKVGLIVLAVAVVAFLIGGKIAGLF